MDIQHMLWIRKNRFCLLQPLSLFPSLFLENINVSIIRSVFYEDAYLHWEHKRSFNLILTVLTCCSNKLFCGVRYGHSTHGYLVHFENIDVSIIKSVFYDESHVHWEHAISFNLICTILTCYSNKLFCDVRYGHSTHAMDS